MNNIKKSAKNLKKYGRNGDTLLAHITPAEANLLKNLGGSSTINPITGLPEYFGGFGGFFSGITDAISDVLGTSGGGGGILGGAEDLVQGAGNVLAESDEFVNREIPGGYILPAAILATYLSGGAAAPLFAGEGAALGAAEAAAALEAAAVAEGATTAGMAAAANTGLAAGTATLGGAAAAEAATQALPYTLAADASNLATSGFNEATIAQNLTASGVDSFVAADAANLAAQGLSEEAIAQVLSQSYTTTELAGTGLTSNALGAASQGITAGQALQGLRAASGLLGGRQQPQQQMPQMQMGGRTQMPQGNVDYSGIYNLLALQRARNPNSLLG
jgi:hypothetical protein